MVNSAKIRGKIVEEGMTIARLAHGMDLSAYTLGRKIAGKSDMSLMEATRLKQLLHIGDDEIEDYFFAPRVAKCN